MTLRLASCAVCLVVIGLSGCGDGRPARTPVSGKVTYNGAGIEGAAVVFVSSEGEPTPTATATTDAAGMFQLSTFEAKDGAVPGSYNVGIVKKKQTGGNTMTEEEEHDAVNAGEEIVYEEPTIEYLTPEKYSTATTSGLTADVTSGENNFVFDLVD
jgi:hypothetical protein